MSLIVGCAEGQPQEKKDQTKKRLGFPEETTRGPSWAGASTCERPPTHANQPAARGCVSYKGNSRCAPGSWAPESTGA